MTKYRISFSRDIVFETKDKTEKIVKELDKVIPGIDFFDIQEVTEITLHSGEKLYDILKTEKGVDARKRLGI